MKIDASTEIYGVLGNPIRHSLSPILQNGWIEESGYNAVYLAFEPKPEVFTSALAGLAHAQIKGLNVTAPFKSEAAKMAIKKTIEVEQIGAANTLKLCENGYEAANTDGKGLVLDLDNRAAHWRENAEIVTILGVGGAAKGILAALLSAGVKEIRLVGRDGFKSAETARIAKALPNSENTIIQRYSWEEMAIAVVDAGLLINATPIGLDSGNSLNWNLEYTRQNAIIYDMTYAQKESEFLKLAKAQNRLALNGLGMLVGQGAFAFEIWFGHLPDFKQGLHRLMKLER